MSGWTADELNKIGMAEEVRVASRRRDGTMRDPVTVWVVRQGDDLYVRSVKGSTGAWFRGTQQQREGHIQAGTVGRDVSFADADRSISDEIDRAYRTKYRRYSANIVNSVLTPQARSATLQLVPRESSHSTPGHPTSSKRI